MRYKRKSICLKAKGKPSYGFLVHQPILYFPSKLEQSHAHPQNVGYCQLIETHIDSISINEFYVSDIKSTKKSLNPLKNVIVIL